MSKQARPEMILEMTKVHQSFRSGFFMKRVQVLKDISFQIPDRSIFGFLGPNGAGKTTLIHLMVGLKKPASGSLKLNGLDCFSPEAKSKIGYLPERPYFYEHLTGNQLLHYFGSLSGMNRNEIEKKIPGVLADVGMSHARHLELKKYSKGMLQRIGIAQAIIHDPEFLVLDEPMSGLDPVGRKEMRELILKLSQEGRTIFFSTHVISDVEAICDQVAIIKKGELVECGAISTLLSGQTKEIEIAIAGKDLASIQKRWEKDTSLSALLLSWREIPEGVKITVSDRASSQIFIQKIISEKLQLLWVNPVRPSLEDIF